MQGIPLLILTFVAFYLGHKLLLFLKALQAIQYVNFKFLKSYGFLLTMSSGTTPGNVLSYHHPF